MSHPISVLSGVRSERVIAAIKSRRERIRAGEPIADGRRLGLVIEGGALRGVCTAAGALVLAQLGLSDVFDEVHATSAAVMNASYFLTNQPLLGISVYFDNCTTASFVNPWRFWKIVDVDYIFDHVVVREKPLNMQKLMACRSALYVAVINRDTGQPMLVDVKTASSPLAAMKASAALPVFYNRAVDVNGHRCMDGGLALPLALPPAIANGCTDLLVLSTRPYGYEAAPASRLSRLVFDVLSARGDRALSQLFKDHHWRSREIRALATGRAAVDPHVNIATVCTSEAETVHRMRATHDQLRSAANSYGRKVLSLFSDREPDWTLPEQCAKADERMIE